MFVQNPETYICQSRFLLDEVPSVPHTDIAEIHYASLHPHVCIHVS